MVCGVISSDKNGKIIKMQLKYILCLITPISKLHKREKKLEEKEGNELK